MFDSPSVEAHNLVEEDVVHPEADPYAGSSFNELAAIAKEAKELRRCWLVEDPVVDNKASQNQIFVDHGWSISAHLGRQFHQHVGHSSRRCWHSKDVLPHCWFLQRLLKTKFRLQTVVNKMLTSTQAEFKKVSHVVPNVPNHVGTYRVEEECD